MPDIPEEAVQAAAEVLYRDYDSEYGTDHLSWRDFADQAWKILEAAAPSIAEKERADERRKVAEEIRKLAEWEFSGGFVNAFAFRERHDRLSHIEVTHLSAAFRALADEIERSARGPR